MAELQAVADQHRGERVLVTLAPDALAGVLAHLGRTSAPGAAGDRLRLEVGRRRLGRRTLGGPLTAPRPAQNSRCSLVSMPLSVS